MNSLLRDGELVSRDAIFRDEGDENGTPRGGGGFGDDDNDHSSGSCASSGIDDRGSRNCSSRSIESSSSSYIYSSSSNSSDHNSKKARDAQDILREAFAQSPQFEEVHVIDNEGKAAAADTNHEEQELEFRLFATPPPTQSSAISSINGTNGVDPALESSKNANIATATTTTQRIRLDSPTPCQNPGFVVSSRQLGYYLADKPSAAKMDEYESAAVEGEEVMRAAAGTVWYGCAYEWKVIRVDSTSDGGDGGDGNGGTGASVYRPDRATRGHDGVTPDERERKMVNGECNQTAIDVEKGGDKGIVGTVTGSNGGIAGDESGKKKKRKSKPGKKARIRIRMLVRAREQKEVQMREKKVRKNQRRKEKRREKEKGLKGLKGTELARN